MFQTSSTKTSSTPNNPQPNMTSSQKSILVNFIAGGIGGITGVVITCPLDVVQTRLQSSFVSFNSNKSSKPPLLGQYDAATMSHKINNSSRFGLNVIHYIRHIAKSEGMSALYKGLIPNLIGIAPSRAMYFSVYTTLKRFFSSTQLSNSNSSWIHMLSALGASWSTSTVTNPIWFMKTRLQLDLTVTGKRPPVVNVIKEVFHNEGVRGFYRGLSASYMGAVETMIYFVLYEKLKARLEDVKTTSNKTLSATDYAFAAFLAKSLATVSVYPHEVARTRLRQESSAQGGKKKYRGFFQTLLTVYKDEKLAGLYGGMGAHLMRQVPNTVIMFLTYEMIVNFFSTE